MKPENIDILEDFKTLSSEKELKGMNTINYITLLERVLYCILYLKSVPETEQKTKIKKVLLERFKIED